MRDDVVEFFTQLAADEDKQIKGRPEKSQEEKVRGNLQNLSDEVNKILLEFSQYQLDPSDPRAIQNFRERLDALRGDFRKGAERWGNDSRFADAFKELNEQFFSLRNALYADEHASAPVRAPKGVRKAAPSHDMKVLDPESRVREGIRDLTNEFVGIGDEFNKYRARAKNSRTPADLRLLGRLLSGLTELRRNLEKGREKWGDDPRFSEEFTTLGQRFDRLQNALKDELQ